MFSLVLASATVATAMSQPLVPSTMDGAMDHLYASLRESMSLFAGIDMDVVPKGLTMSELEEMTSMLMELDPAANTTNFTRYLEELDREGAAIDAMRQSLTVHQAGVHMMQVGRAVRSILNRLQALANRVRAAVPPFLANLWNTGGCANVVAFPFTQIINRYGANMCNRMPQIAARFVGWCGQVTTTLALPQLTPVCATVGTVVFINTCESLRDRLLAVAAGQGSGGGNITNWAQNNICNRPAMRLGGPGGAPNTSP